MKKFMCGFLLGAILFCIIGAMAASYVANPVDFKVLVNGKEFVSDPPALEVEGRTYLPLRAMGDALGVPVNWNEELRQAEVGLTSSTNEKLFEMSEYLTSEVWNKGFWFVRDFTQGQIDTDSYISEFAESATEEFNIEKIISHIDSTRPKMNEYNNIILTLSDNEIKESWSKVYEEYIRLYGIIKTNSPLKSDKSLNFDTTFFVKVRDNFSDKVNSLQ